MTLDEAIAKAKADGDMQLFNWLRQARGADAAARWYTRKLSDARKVADDNVKLRKLAKKAWRSAEAFCQLWEGPCKSDDVTIAPVCPLRKECIYGQLERDLQKLGVKVKE